MTESQKQEFNELFERVNEQTDIVEVVSRYTQLNPKDGENGKLFGKCPFHDEDGENLCVMPDKKFFYCFGCKTGGNAFKFIALAEGISYLEAIELQAKRLEPAT